MKKLAPNDSPGRTLSRLPTYARPDSTPAYAEGELPQRATVHPLATHTTTSNTDTTAPPHFTVFLILGCGFMGSS
jgi:hypothetical protein